MPNLFKQKNGTPAPVLPSWDPFQELRALLPRSGAFHPPIEVKEGVLTLVLPRAPEPPVTGLARHASAHA